MPTKAQQENPSIMWKRLKRLAGRGSSSWITYKSFADEADAQQTAGRLESRGVRHVRVQRTAGGFFSSAKPKWEVQVLREGLRKIGRGGSAKTSSRAAKTLKRRTLNYKGHKISGNSMEGYVVPSLAGSQAFDDLDAAKRFVADEMKYARRNNRGRSNDVVSAQDRYEKFHGRPSKELIEVKTPVHVHSALSGMGELKKLKIRCKNAQVVLSNFKGAILCQNEKATQLFIEGGDQAVNLADFGIRQPHHEKEILGECTAVYYFTTKDHLAPQDGGTAVYHHKFGRKKPVIVYDVPNALLEFAGGGYTIPEEGIDG